MEGVVWATLGILTAATFGNLYYLGSKIDGLGSELTGRIDALDERLTGRIDALDERLSARIDSMSSRIDRLSDRFDVHASRHAG